MTMCFKTLGLRTVRIINCGLNLHVYDIFLLLLKVGLVLSYDRVIKSTLPATG